MRELLRFIDGLDDIETISEVGCHTINLHLCDLKDNYSFDVAEIMYEYSICNVPATDIMTTEEADYFYGECLKYSGLERLTIKLDGVDVEINATILNKFNEKIEAELTDINL